MEKELENIGTNEVKDDLQEEKPKKTGKLKKILFVGGVLLLAGLGIAWKCWDGQRFDLKKLSTDELKDLRNKLQEVLLSPDSDQEAKKESSNCINVIDNIIRRRDPVDMENYVFPKGGDHGTNLWKPD